MTFYDELLERIDAQINELEQLKTIINKEFNKKDSVRTYSSYKEAWGDAVC